MTSRSSHASRANRPARIAGSVETAEPRAALGLEARLDLPSGRSIECHDAPAGGELVSIRCPEGQVELEVRLTDQGPVLRFDAAQLEFRAAGRIRATCETFEVVAAGDIVQRAGGNLRQEAAGDATLRAGGDLSTRARITDITSTRGDVRIRANDDVTLNGERVKLNCQA